MQPQASAQISLISGQEIEADVFGCVPQAGSHMGHNFPFIFGRCVAQKSMDIDADACGGIGVLTFEGDASPRTSKEIYVDVVRAHVHT